MVVVAGLALILDDVFIVLPFFVVTGFVSCDYVVVGDDEDKFFVVNDGNRQIKLITSL